MPRRFYPSIITVSGILDEKYKWQFSHSLFPLSVLFNVQTLSAEPRSEKQFLFHQIWYSCKTAQRCIILYFITYKCNEMSGIWVEYLYIQVKK
jgi:hypothetical protein